MGPESQIETLLDQPGIEDVLRRHIAPGQLLNAITLSTFAENDIPVVTLSPSSITVDVDSSAGSGDVQIILNNEAVIVSTSTAPTNGIIHGNESLKRPSL